MNEEDYEVDENKKPVSFRQKIFPKEEEVDICAVCFSSANSYLTLRKVLRLKVCFIDQVSLK